jgi:hypothetical protein
MKLALTGAVAALAVTFATAALAQTVTEGPGYRAPFYSDAYGQTLGSGKPHTDDGRDWQSGNAMMLHHAYDSDRYRYHGGPKSND